ncbi:MAG TPA: ScpA family protein [Actinomycetota bacterium]
MKPPRGADSIAPIEAHVPAPFDPAQAAEASHSESREEFLVEIPVFSGPFRLLAELILDQKVDVCDVPVALVTDRFLQRGSQALPGWTLEEGTWFLAVCASMLELKVGRLLPRATVETEEDLLGGDSPDLLFARSVELAAIRQVAERLRELMEAAALMHGRDAGPPPELAHLYPDVLASVSLEDLRAAAMAQLAPPPVVDLGHVAPIRVSVAEALDTVERRLAELSQARFRDLLDDGLERIHVVVRFLALLELHRQGKVELSQAERFGEIEVVWHGSADEGEVRELEPHGWDDVTPEPTPRPRGFLGLKRARR